MVKCPDPSCDSLGMTCLLAQNYGNTLLDGASLWKWFLAKTLIRIALFANLEAFFP